MPASHSAVRRTLAGRGNAPNPLSKIAQGKEKYHNEKTEPDDHYPLYL